MRLQEDGKCEDARGLVNVTLQRDRKCEAAKE